MELIDYLRMLARFWRGVLAMACVGLLIAIAYLVVTPSTYLASARIFVGVGGDAGASAGLAQSASQFTLGRMPSYAALADSPDLFRGVRDEFGIPLSDREFSDRVRATVPAGTVLLNVSGSSTSPDQAADIANAAAERLTQQIRLLETPGGSRTSQVDARITSVATAPGAPVSPNRPLVLLLGLLVGLGGGVLVAALREQTRVRPPDAAPGSSGTRAGRRSRSAARAASGGDPAGAGDHVPDGRDSLDDLGQHDDDRVAVAGASPSRFASRSGPLQP